MKRFLLIFGLLLAGSVNAGVTDLGILKPDQYATFEVYALDSAGIRDRGIDSVHVRTYLNQNTLASAFSTRSTTYPFAIGIDTVKEYTDTVYYFNDQIQDIDGTPSPTNAYILNINVICWADGIPTDNRATAQVIPDSLHLYLADASSALDSLQLLDEKYTSLRDSINLVHAEIDTEVDSALQALADDHVLKKKDSALYKDVKTFQPAALTNLTDTLDGRPVDVNAVTVGDKTGYALTDAQHGIIADSFYTYNIFSVTPTIKSFLSSVRSYIVLQDSVTGLAAASTIDFYGREVVDSIDFYQGQMVVFLTGNNAGEVRLIRGNSKLSVPPDVTNWIVDPALQFTPVQGDLFSVIALRSPLEPWQDKGGNDAFANLLPDSSIQASTMKTNTITAPKIAADAIGASELAVDGIREIAGYVSDSTWDADTTGRTAGGTFGYAATHGAAASIDYEQFYYNIDTTNVDSSAIGVWLVNNLAGGAASIPDSLLKTVNQIRALVAKEGFAGLEQDSIFIRFVSLSGDNSDGKTPATAWNFNTTGVDSLNKFSKALDNANYNGALHVFFSPDSFMTNDKLCSLYANNTTWWGAGEFSLTPATKIYKLDGQVANDSVDADLVRVYGENCKIFNMELCAVDTTGDPEGTPATGGNNALTIDTLAHNWEVGKVRFPSPNHKPFQMNASHGLTKVAKGGHMHDVVFDRPKKHAIDGFFSRALFERIYVYGPEVSGDHGTGAAAIQLLGTGCSDCMYNTVKDFVINGSDVGVALINTDSNIIVNGVFNRTSTAPITVTKGKNGNMFNNIEINTPNPVRDYGVLANGSFEDWSQTAFLPIGWSAGVDSGAIGVRSTIHYDTPRTGGLNFLIRGDTTAADNQQGYVNTDPIRMAAGKWYFSIWARGDTSSIPSGDTLDVILYKVKSSGDSAAITWDNKWILGAASYQQVDTVFTVNSEGAYYLSFLAGGSAAGGNNTSNAVFLDDAFLDVFGVNFIDSTVEGDGSAVVTYYAIDTSGTDEIIPDIHLPVYNINGALISKGLSTNANGFVTYGFTAGDTVIIQPDPSIGWVFPTPDTIFGVTNGLIDSSYGYNYEPDAPVAGKTATVTVYVRKSDNTPAVGVPITMYIARNNVIDSAGAAVSTTPQTETTDTDGKVQFTCMWSSYMVPATDWVISSSQSGLIRVTRVTVPRETTYQVDLTTLRD